VYSEILRNVSQLEWSWLGREIAVDVDHERLDRARSHIAHYSRLPDLFATTGFKQQWPLSVVVLRAADAMHPVRDSSGSA
jgi:hypothetical protein